MKPCFPSVNCRNVGFGTFECDSCPKGYEGDGQSCTDIDEVISQTCSIRSVTDGYFECRSHYIKQKIV